VAPKAGIDVLHSGLWLTARRPAAAAVLDAFMQTEMGADCELLTPAQAAERHPALRTEGLQSVLYSPHELRVESRTAIPHAGAVAAAGAGGGFPLQRNRDASGHAARHHLARQLPRRRVVVCNNADPGGLFADEWTEHQVQLCQLQMLRVQPQAGFALRDRSWAI
jgi:glycine/D-amino acid oxidase-like deaminating enzyme